MKPMLYLITGAVLLLEIILFSTGIINRSEALLSFLLIEIILLGLVVILALITARRTGEKLTSVLPPLQLIMWEAQLFADLFRAMRHRIIIPASAIPISATKGQWTLPIVLTLVTAIEVLAIELLLPWPLIRALLLIISIYSLLWLWAYFAQHAVYPHYINGNHLVLRRGRNIIATVSQLKEITDLRTFDNDSHKLVDARLTLGASNGTNLAVSCAETLAMPFSWPWKKALPEEITQIRLWVDDPKLFKSNL